MVKNTPIFLIKRVALGVLLFSIFVATPLQYGAAQSDAVLYVTPGSGSYTVGEAITLSVLVSSPNQAMNAAAGVLEFPTDLLEAISVTKSNIVLNLWVQDPQVNAGAGTISFEGIAFNPGFTGSGGAIFTANFRVKKAGTANVRFQSGSVLANDGQGTNILSSMKGASFTAKSNEPPEDNNTPEPTPPPTSDPPALPPDETPPANTNPEEDTERQVPEQVSLTEAPNIYSSSHPDSNAWYANTTADFSWDVPPDADAVRLLIGRLPQGQPNVVYDTPISSKTITDLEDGVWYFHVQLSNGEAWGPVAHFPLRIDTVEPTITDLREIERDDSTNPVVQVTASATDGEGAGIAYYECRFGGGEWARQEEREEQEGGESFTCTSDPLRYGTHSVSVRVIDGAGNKSEESLTVAIEGLPKPRITYAPEKMGTSDIETVAGQTKPSARVVLVFERQEDSLLTASFITDFFESHENRYTFETIADENGRFSSAIMNMGPGSYKGRVEAIDARGGASYPADINLSVEGKPAWLYLLLLLPIILITTAGWRRRRTVINAIRRVFPWLLSQVPFLNKDPLDTAVNTLEEDMRYQIALLENVRKQRDLTAQEEKFLQQLRKELYHIVDDIEEHS